MRGVLQMFAEEKNCGSGNAGDSSDQIEPALMSLF